jgi:predicted GNAT superfamily acetyltransferase
MQKLDNIEIRLLTTTPELENPREIESAIWGAEDVVPMHQILTVIKNGGFVLGAFQGNKLIGHQYSFPGYDG